MSHKSEKIGVFKYALKKMEKLAVDGADNVDGLAILDADDYKGYTIQDLARLQKQLQNLHVNLDSTKKRVGVIFDNVRTRYLPAMMDSQDMTKFTVEGLGTVSITDDLRVKVLNRDAEFEWLEEIGSGDLIQDTVNSSSLKALLRRKMVAGEAVPDDVFELSPFTRATITKR